MNRRIIYVTLLSCLGIILSFIFLRPKVIEVSRDSKEVLAYIHYSVNDVQRKSTGQFIWQEVIRGDQLYQGDVLRTSAHSTAEVNFFNDNVSFSIGPETTIIIEKESEKFNLDVMKGDIFLKNQKNDLSFIVKAKDMKVEVTNATMGISLNKAGDIGLEVFEGETKILGDHKTVVKRNEKLEILKDKITVKAFELLVKRPLNVNPILYNPADKGLEVELQSEKVISKIEVMAGASKNSLKTIPTTEISNNTVLSKFPAGGLFWKVSGSDGNTIVETPIFYNQFKPLSVPYLTFPAQGEFFYLKNSSSPIRLKWDPGNLSDEIILEVSKDKKFANIAVTKIVSGQNYDLHELKEEGEYFWRIRGAIEGVGDVSSSVSSFQFKYGEGIVPPILQSPENLAQFTEDDAQRGVTLSWKEVPDASDYIVTLKNDKGHFQEYKTVKNSWINTELKVGNYSWSVMARSHELKKSETGIERYFKIESLPMIVFEDFKTQFYLSNTDNLFAIRWKKPNIKDSMTYKLSITNPDGSSIEEIVSGEFFNLKPEKEGIYSFKVTATDTTGKTLAISQKQSTSIRSLPLLEGPKFSEKTKGITASDGFGSVELEFITVKDAQYYLVEVKTISGKIMKVIQFEKSRGRVEGLLPGDYEISARSVDKYNRQGQLGEMIKIKVPSVSGLSKPKLNKVQVR